MRFKKVFPTLVWTFLLNGGLNHIIFLFLFFFAGVGVLGLVYIYIYIYIYIYKES